MNRSALPSAALPRVHDIALEAISHGDVRIDTERIVRFITAYQTVTPLNLGELWAIPIMLRLALIENLRRVGARIATEFTDQARANGLPSVLDEARCVVSALFLLLRDFLCLRREQKLILAFLRRLMRHVLLL